MEEETTKKYLKSKQDFLEFFEPIVRDNPILLEVLGLAFEKYLVEKSPYGKLRQNILLDKISNAIKNFGLQYMLMIWRVTGYLVESWLNVWKYDIKNSNELTRNNFNYLMYLPSTHPTDYNIMFPIIKKIDELGASSIVVTTTWTYKSKYEELNKLKNSEFVFLDNEIKNLNLFSFENLNEKVKQQFNGLTSYIENNNEILRILTSNKNFILYKLKIQKILEQIYINIITRWKIKAVIAVSLSGALLKASIEKGVKTIRLQHAGGYDDVLIHPKEEEFLVWGGYYKNKFSNKASPRTHLEPLGCPKFDVVPDLKKASQSDTFYKEFNLDKSKTMVVFFSKFHGAGLTKNSSIMILEELKNLIHTFQEEINLIIKLHPSEDKILYSKTWDESTLAKIKILKDEIPLYNLLQYCDIAISLPSTTILEAMAFDIPVVQVHFADYLKVIDFYKYGGGVLVRNREEFISTIDNLLHDKKYKQEIIENQRKFIDYSLTNLGSAAEKIAEYILNLNQTSSINQMP